MLGDLRGSEDSSVSSNEEEKVSEGPGDSQYITESKEESKAKQAKDESSGYSDEDLDDLEDALGNLADDLE